MQYQVAMWNGTEWQAVASVQATDAMDALGTCAVMFADLPQHFLVRAFAFSVWCMAATGVCFSGTYRMQASDVQSDVVSVQAIERMGAKRQRYARFVQIMRDMRSGS